MKENLTYTLRFDKHIQKQQSCATFKVKLEYIFRKVFMGGTKSKPQKNKGGFTEKSSVKTGFVIIELTDFFFFKSIIWRQPHTQISS